MQTSLKIVAQFALCVELLAFSLRDLHIGANVVYENENGKIKNRIKHNETNNIKYNNINDK